VNADLTTRAAFDAWRSDADAAKARITAAVDACAALLPARRDLCSRPGSAWALPTCSECGGVGHDEDDDSDCSTCEGDGSVPFRADRAADRALVAADFVEAWGGLVAMSALGFHVGLASEKRDEIEAAAAEWATVYRDAFGSSADRLVSTGGAGVTTLAAAMRDAVAAAAVVLAGQERPLVAVAMPEDVKGAA
jgi:hypothetical protein